LSGDIGTGLWDLQVSHIERDNHLTYDPTEFVPVRQVERHYLRQTEKGLTPKNGDVKLE
jgi:hypothetical protein